MNFLKINDSKVKNYRMIGFFRLIFYFLKLSFTDKALLVIASILLFLSTVFGLIASTLTSKIVILNWYVIFSTVLLLILVSRLGTFFLFNKIDDKSIGYITQQKTLRITIYLSTVFSSLLLLFMLVFISSGIVGLINIKDQTLIKYLYTYFIYSVATLICLTSFIFFINIFLKQQLVAIVVSLLMISLFVSGIPEQLYANKMANISINMNYKGSNISYTAKEINETLTFQTNVEKEKIKFPKLSKYINQNFLDSGITIDNFTNNNTGNSSVQKRLDMWDKLGLINHNETKLDDYQLTIASINNYRTEMADFKKDDHVNVSLSFKSGFKTIEEIKTLEENETNANNKEIISEFLDFYSYFQTQTKNKYSLQDDQSSLITKDWDVNWSLYGDFIESQLDEENSSVTLVTTDQSRTASSYNIKTGIFQTYLVSNYFLTNKNQDLIFKFSGSDPGVAQYNLLINALEQKYYMELFARVLEGYFLNQDSSYTILKSSTIINDENYQNYLSYEEKFNIFKMVFPPANLNLLFNKYAGKEWALFWFDYNSTSKIDFTTQDNIFFSYANFKFTLDDDNKTSVSGMKYTNQMIFILPEVIFLIISLIGGSYFFIRKDFK